MPSERSISVDKTRGLARRTTNLMSMESERIDALRWRSEDVHTWPVRVCPDDNLIWKFIFKKSYTILSVLIFMPVAIVLQINGWDASAFSRVVTIKTVCLKSQNWLPACYSNCSACLYFIKALLYGHMLPSKLDLRYFRYFFLTMCLICFLLSFFLKITSSTSPMLKKIWINNNTS